MNDGDKKDKPLVEPVLTEKIQDIVDDAQLPKRPSLDTAENIASKTTIEQDLKSASQRARSFTWEDTQRKVALFCVYSTMATSMVVIIVGFFYPVDRLLIVAAFTFMSGTTNLIVGFYFSRLIRARSASDAEDKTGEGGDR